MSKILKTVQTVMLSVSPEQLWPVLTQSQYSKQYMFNCAVNSDWKIGSSITWEGNYQGYEAFQKGEILDIQEPQKIKFTTFDPNYGIEDIPENYIHVTYLVRPEGNQTEFTVINETFDGNDKRSAHIKAGWKSVLEKIKEITDKMNGK